MAGKNWHILANISGSTGPVFTKLSDLVDILVGMITLISFLPCEAMLSVVYAVVVCLSVCVCLSHSGIVSKRLNVGSCK